MSDLDQDMKTYDMLLRYAKGEAMADLAAECDVSEPVLRNRMRNFKPEDYKAAKGEAAQARIDLRHAEIKHVLSMNLEGLKKDLSKEEADISIGDRCKIEKTYGDRAALADGEATESVKHTGSVGSIIINPPKDTDG